jgi:5'-nucleotidase
MILVTNDDGIDSDGLFQLKKALEAVDRVEVLAPNRNWTAAGHTKTMHRPLRVAEITLSDGSTAYSSDGSPSDCVALAFLGILPERPTLVFSGINKGPNLGSDVTYSGTVAAAMEAVVCGVPAVAMSLNEFYQWDFTYAAEFAARLARHILENGLDSDVLLNVNVPHLPRSEVKGVAVTRLGKRVYNDELIRRTDPFGRDYFWIGGEIPTGELEEGTDLAAIHENYVSITPILMDLTNHALIQQVSAWNLRP